MMEKTHLRPYLDVLVSNEDVTCGKPSPDIYLTAVEWLGVRPEECLAVEDNDNGVRSAQAAGVHVMVVDSVLDVTFDNVMDHIRRADGSEK